MVPAWSVLHVVSLDTKLCSTLSLFTHVYKLVPAIKMLRGDLAGNGLASYPGGIPRRNIPSHFTLQFDCIVIIFLTKQSNSVLRNDVKL